MPENVQQNEALAARMAGLMASAMLRGEPSDAAKTERLTRALMRQPAFGELAADPKSQRLLREGRGADLCALFASKDSRINGPRGPYARPKALARDDAEFLKTASDSMKGGGAEGSPAQTEREGALLQELTKRMDNAQSLLEKGIQPSERDAAELVSAAKRYNDGGTGIPGGRREAAYSKQAMCVLARYMPAEEFSAYCEGINAARGLEAQSSRGRVDPRNYNADLLNGSTRTAKELMDETRLQLASGVTVDSCARAAAVCRLSGGDPSALITAKQLDTEVASYKKPGSAFMQVMQDPAAKEKLASLASKGLAGSVGGSVIDESRRHSAGVARRRMDDAAAAAAAGRADKHTAAEMLAAKELAFSTDPSTGLTDAAFRQRADAIASSPGFAGFAQRYDNDPAYRARMDRELAAGDEGNVLTNEYTSGAVKGPYAAPALKL